MNLFAKRFRSKAPSAASLSPIQLANRRRVGFDFLSTPYYDTVSWREGVPAAGRNEGEGEWFDKLTMTTLSLSKGYPHPAPPSEGDGTTGVDTFATLNGK